MPLAAGSITAQGGVATITVTQTASPSGGTAPYTYRIGYRTPAGSGGYTYRAVGATGPWPITGIAAGAYGVILEATDAVGAIASTSEVTATVTAATTTQKQLVILRRQEPIALLGQNATRFTTLLRRKDPAGNFYDFSGVTLSWCILPAFPISDPADGDWTTVVPVESQPAVGVAPVYVIEFVKSGLTRGREYIVWLRYRDGTQDERVQLGYITPDPYLNPVTAVPYVPGSEPSSTVWLTSTSLDVDSTYRYITGLQADGGWQINRRHRTTQVVTVATAENNPSYNYTTLAQLRTDRGTLTYA